MDFCQFQQPSRRIMQQVTTLGCTCADTCEIDRAFTSSMPRRSEAHRHKRCRQLFFLCHVVGVDVLDLQFTQSRHTDDFLAEARSCLFVNVCLLIGASCISRAPSICRMLCYLLGSLPSPTCRFAGVVCHTSLALAPWPMLKVMSLLAIPVSNMFLSMPMIYFRLVLAQLPKTLGLSL